MIGILAGMGPKSTGPFVDCVVDQCQQIYGAKHDMDFPHMMIYSCPTPFYMDRPVDHAAMEKAIINGAQRLERTGVQFIVIPCNTAHLYYENIKTSVSVPVLNMVDETILKLPNSAERAALLATPATVQSGIYQQALHKLGVDLLHRDHWQHWVNAMITSIKAGQIQESIILWQRLHLELVEMVDIAILACTDLNVITKGKQTELAIVDSSLCLAQATVKRYILEGHT
ncbi:aspartate/glutamate racemase family protein [Paenibacillus elgii]|uniref:Amino-acid racemase n=1 Tax=Paenibacillus elgii TaxID=189691 RepID=A0A161RWE3_9BACL|nr:amino acid racemase [Paenibacillus elgii]KZE75729.1 amino-acid racemase [Paenibacillus elgii]NEN83728.1 amino acid racemase [Paenibacillus elgii]